MSIWLIILLAFVTLLLVSGIILYSIQERFIFHAEKLPEDYKFSFTNDFEEVNLKAKDRATLNGLFFKVKESKGVILFFHNHSGNIEHKSISVNFLFKLNYDIIIMDYRGYGKSTGKFNEKLLLEDSLLWYDFAKNNYKEKQITIYGRGIGATFATYVASKNNPKRLCLESPMYNMYYLVNKVYPFIPSRFVLKYKFDTAKYYKEVKCWIHIFHGVQNKLIHYTNSEKLLELNKENTELDLISDGNHYNLINSKLVLNKIKEILN